MDIAGIGSSAQATFRPKPAQPTAPVPPSGGNIENRQPPSEPSPPSAGAVGGLIDIRV